MAAYATDHVYGRKRGVDENNTQKDTSPKLAGFAVRPVIERILLPLLFQLNGNVKLHFMQLILPILLLYWFSCRPSAIANVFIISEKDYEKRNKLHVHLPMLAAGLYFIKTRNGYHVKKLEFKNFITYEKNKSKDKDDDDKEGEMDFELETTEQLQKYPYLLNAFQLYLPRMP